MARKMIEVRHDGIEGTAVVPETALEHMDGKWEPVDPAAASVPAGNASREAWAAYALSVGATEADIADLTRDQLRDRYSSGE